MLIHERNQIKLNKLSVLITFLLIFSFGLFGQNTTRVTYQASDEIITNPERGFFSSSSGALNLSYVTSLRAQHISLIQRIYTIPQFKDKPLSLSFLDQVEADFNIARQGGIKLIPRFSYTDELNGADAALDTILLHISQIKPLLQANYDVIAFMDAGFIGAWGEWYYSTHHLNNTQDRRTVLFALLDALPVERDVVVRTPNYKRLIFNDSLPLNPQEAFNGTKKARTGAHNDCFLADETDAGTYLWNDIEGDKNYLNQDNRFVPQSGETCSPGSYSDCSHALQDLARMHWSALNKDYNEDVLSGWENNGCMPEIKRRLGYRLALLQADLPDSLKPGTVFSMHFDMANYGFAGMYNPRLLEIILRNTQTHQTYRLTSEADPRFWQSGDTVHIDIEGGIPEEMVQGTYEMMLHLADTVTALRYRPEYAVRLANRDVWEDSTGYNRLQHDLVINEQAGGISYTGQHYFELFSTQSTPPSPSSKISIDGLFYDWEDVPLMDQTPDQESSGDAKNDDADLIDMWVTNDATTIYISYQVQGVYNSDYFYHVFFDTDADPNTGYHSANSYMGIDYMLENSILWKYSGTNGEWSWTSMGNVAFASGSAQKGRVELSLTKAQLGIGESTTTLNLIFNVNENDDNFPDDYAPNAYQQHSYIYTFLTTAIENKKENTAVNRFTLKAYPNPFNGDTKIRFTPLPGKDFQIHIYDLRGRMVKTFVGMRPGQNTIIWDGSSDHGERVSSGVYFLEIKNQKQHAMLKLLLVK